MLACAQPCAHKTSAIASRSSSQFRPRWKVHSHAGSSKRETKHCALTCGGPSTQARWTLGYWKGGTTTFLCLSRTTLKWCQKRITPRCFQNRRAARNANANEPTGSITRDKGSLLVLVGGVDHAAQWACDCSFTGTGILDANHIKYEMFAKKPLEIY